MRLNIRSPEAHKLAKAISLLTGKSMTRVVIEALREHYRGVERQHENASMDEILSHADHAAAYLGRSDMARADPIYCESSLPELPGRPSSPTAVLSAIRKLGLRTPSEAAIILRLDRNRR